MVYRVLKEPLTHFIVLGGLIFAAYAWLGSGDAGQDDRKQIVIDQAKLDHLKKLWKLQWRRDPAPTDLAAIIDRELRQEVFYREALTLGLDRNDAIIKRRLAQKMEAVADDLSTLMQPPTDDRLKAYFRSREDFFKLPKAYGFKQILFLPDEQDREARIEATLVSLQGGAEPPEDRRNKLAVPGDWPLTPVSDLQNAFGGDFARALDNLPIGQWSGPVRSGYGWHLVFLEAKEETRMPEFEKVRDFVAREYEYRSVLKSQDRMFKELIDKYKVTITAIDVPDAVRAGYAK